MVSAAHDNLSQAEYNTLLSHHIWSSEAITFHIILRDPLCPEFLFTIRGFTMLDKSYIHTMVSKVWNDEETKNFVTHEVNTACVENRKSTEETLTHLIKSLTVTHLKIKNKGSTLTPHFNIYTDRKSTTEEEL